MVECTALEMRHRCKPIGGSNPSLSATYMYRLHIYRDRRHSTHFDLIGGGWTIDLVTLTAGTILVTSFALAILAQCVR